MRLFIAVDLPENIKSYLYTIQRSLKGPNVIASYVYHTKMHLTLKFLGEVDESNYALVKKKLSAIKQSKFTLTLSNISSFPNEFYTKVIWVGFSEDSDLLSLKENIESSLQGLFPREKLSAHITLCRVKFVKDKKLLKSQIDSIKIDPIEFNVDSFNVYKSTLTPKGPVYEELLSIKLK